MAYVVVHGADQARELSGNASECLELVKTLQARAETPIDILDENGASLRLRDLEALHKAQVERGLQIYRAPAVAKKRPRSLPDGKKGRIAAGLLMATAIAAIIGVITSRAPAPPAEGDASRDGAVNRPAPAPPPKQGQEAGPAPTAAQTANEKPAGAAAGERMGSGEAAASSYTVVANDTLRAIAKKLFHDAGRWRDIARANPDINPNRLRPGQIIALPKERKLARPR